jgi:hypothetical protein
VEGSVLVVPVDHSASELSEAGGRGRWFSGRWADGWRLGRRRGR